MYGVVTESEAIHVLKEKLDFESDSSCISEADNMTKKF
jgi:hypothetical protein